jgi:hypothetical protein
MIPSFSEADITLDCMFVPIVMHGAIRVSQEGRSVFWEVIGLAILTEKQCVHTRVQMVSEIEPFHCTVPKLLIRKRYYIQFPILVVIVQVTKVNSLLSVIHFRKFCQHQRILQLV